MRERREAASGAPIDEQGRVRVLVADDDGEIRRLVAIHLGRAGYDVIEAADGFEALTLARRERPDLILLDVAMPVLDGLAVCREIEASGSGAPPVIFLTARGDVSARVSGLDAGATDYVVKPFAGAELIARVRSALRTKALTDALSVAATTDHVTGLLNRRQLDVRAGERIAIARRGRALTCLLIDVDKFKEINDTYGHTAGDHVLREVARRVEEVTRASDVVARYGGDEFVVLLEETEIGAARSVERIHSALAEPPLELPDGHHGPEGETPANASGVHVRVSVGVASWKLGMDVPEMLYAAADAALYEAKRLGGRTVLLAAPAPGEGKRPNEAQTAA
jgi:two-component system cell cycle response regulator